MKRLQPAYTGELFMNESFYKLDLDKRFEKMAVKFERRQFSRYEVELVIEITAKDITGETYRDMSILQNISSGGANFITQKADKYYQGQKLELKIYLPGTDEVKACIKGPATVVRTESMQNSPPDQNVVQKEIAVVIEMALQFERIDLNKEKTIETFGKP